MRSNVRTWPIALSVLVAMMLTILPLPDWATAFWPNWIGMTIVYWSLHASHRVSIGTAWTAGLILDTLKGSILGQHTLALTVLSFLTVKFHLRIRVFPMGQQTLTVFALLAVYEFLLFWVDGIVGVAALGLNRWGPVISSAIMWPVVASLLNLIQRRLRVE